MLGLASVDNNAPGVCTIGHKITSGCANHRHTPLESRLQHG